MNPLKFDRLEEQVKLLLESHKTLAVENKKLMSLIKVRGSEIEWLKERLKTMDREKGLVKAKVEGLIERIDSIV